MQISEFQELMKTLYFESDTSRGIPETYMWLVEEMGELSEAINNDFGKEKISEELADIIAWTCSLANLFDIDLEEALFEKYPNKCLKCGSNPCVCHKKK
ncbi:MAG: MazG nucleotide pyrophosphohydrolase domain-containing protein [Promethearchaeia archaeon]